MELDARKEAAKLFNETWDLIDVPANERTPEQSAEMLHKAHASRYLWGLIGEPANFTRGEWQVSHCYALLGYGAPALLHGRLSLDIVIRNDIRGMDLAFGYEAVARAYAVLGDGEAAEQNVKDGLAAAALLEDENDRKYAEGELNNILKG